MEKIAVQLLTKVADFVKLALQESAQSNTKTAALEQEVLSYRIKEAAFEVKRQQIRKDLEKAAEALYDADFITSEVERTNFLKRAQEDTGYLARTLEKVCNAADVALIGSPARVANDHQQKKLADYDPVMAALNGETSQGRSIIDE
jgi:hypothetical protein